VRVEQLPLVLHQDLVWKQNAKDSQKLKYFTPLLVELDELTKTCSWASFWKLLILDLYPKQILHVRHSCFFGMTNVKVSRRFAFDNLRWIWYIRSWGWHQVRQRSSTLWYTNFCSKHGVRHTYIFLISLSSSLLTGNADSLVNNSPIVLQFFFYFLINL